MLDLRTQDHVQRSAMNLNPDEKRAGISGTWMNRMYGLPTQKLTTGVGASTWMQCASHFLKIAVLGQSPGSQWQKSTRLRRCQYRCLPMDTHDHAPTTSSQSRHPSAVLALPSQSRGRVCRPRLPEVHSKRGIPFRLNSVITARPDWVTVAH